MFARIRNVFKLISVTLILSACDASEIADPDYYNAINKLTKNEGHFEAIIVGDPLRFNKSMKGLFDYKSSDFTKKSDLQPLQPTQTVDYVGVLVGWTIQGLLDSLEADYMYRSQDPALKLLLDKTKLNAKTISLDDLREEIHHDDRVVYYVSYPLYNQSRTKLILTVENPGESNTYLFEFTDNMWTQKGEHKNWVR